METPTYYPVNKSIKQLTRRRDFLTHKIDTKQHSTASKSHMLSERASLDTALHCMELIMGYGLAHLINFSPLEEQVWAKTMENKEYRDQLKKQRRAEREQSLKQESSDV